MKNRIGELRKGKKYRREEFAAAPGVTKKTVNAIEK
jgi:DNA-binding XRE family transcriptional regulator